MCIHESLQRWWLHMNGALNFQTVRWLMMTVLVVTLVTMITTPSQSMLKRIRCTLGWVVMELFEHQVTAKRKL